VFEPFATWKLSRDLQRRREQRKLKGQSNGTANGNGHSAVHQPSRKELKQMRRSVMRFAEQGWSVTYYPIQWCFGLYILRNLTARIFDPTDLWRNYPHIPLAGPIKAYYLSQTAFYIHQVLILNAEARRKDHVQMMTHHFITVFLMAVSYFFNVTRVGCLIMVLMDWCDILLPLAKMIRYVEYSQLLCDTIFGGFLLSWVVTRHVLFIIVIWSTYRDCPRLIPFDWAPERGHYMNKSSWITFCVSLSALQVLQIIWFGMISRVAWRVVTGAGAADSRSDDEDDGEVDEKEA